MENKDRYFKSFIENNGQLNEIDLGEKIGLNEQQTGEIIAQLLSEYKIEYAEYRSCNYRLIKPARRINTSR